MSDLFWYDHHFWLERGAVRIENTEVFGMPDATRAAVLAGQKLARDLNATVKAAKASRRERGKWEGKKK
jgi:hypothetical protein